jgi:nucleoside-diphosphate-sugar epimerase
MKILITGSNGIIGRQILNELIINYPGSDIYTVNRTISNSDQVAGVQSVELDILNVDESKIVSLFEKIKPSLFFHLAWDTNHSDYLTSSSNVKWEVKSKVLIDCFYRSGGKRFVGVGSSIEYDWKEQSPFDENASKVGGNGWLYGASKLNVAQYLKSLEGISYLWCRIFFVFGPGQSSTRLIPLIIQNTLGNRDPLSLNLKLKRDYLSTFEIARQIVMMQKTDYSGPVNICSGKGTELGEIVNLISGLLNKKIDLSPDKYDDKFEIESLYGSIEILKNYYDNYTYSADDFKRDIQKTIEYYLPEVGAKKNNLWTKFH